MVNLRFFYFIKKFDFGSQKRNNVKDCDHVQIEIQNCEELFFEGIELQLRTESIGDYLFQIFKGCLRLTGLDGQNETGQGHLVEHCLAEKIFGGDEVEQSQRKVKSFNGNVKVKAQRFDFFLKNYHPDFRVFVA